MTRWPAINTPVGGQRYVAPMVYVALVTLVFLIVPVGGALLTLIAVILGGSDTPPNFATPAYLLGILLTLSPPVSWAGLLVGVPLSILAMARGYAGWLVSTLAGAVIGLLCGMFLESPEFMAPGGALMGGLYWIFLRWLAPAALLVPLDQDATDATASTSL